MNRTYTVTHSPISKRPRITLNATLGDIPFNVWKDVGVLAGSSFDNDEGHVVYEFLVSENLKKAEEILAGAMWEKMSKYKQVRTNTPECTHLIGRVGTVDDTFVDEKGNTHVHTIEDNVWCPLALMEKVND